MAGLRRVVLVLAALLVLVRASFYSELGVKSTASEREIKRAYRKLALELHPDKLGGEATDELHQQFLRVQAAYEVLSDPDKRRIYDESGEAAATQATARTATPLRHYHFEPMDLYIRFPMGAMEFHYRNPPTRKAAEIAVELPLTLEEVYAGTERRVNVTRKRTCPHCGGCGADSPEHLHACPVCGGTGRRMFLRATENGFAQVTHTLCPHCEGTGQVTHHPCHVCNHSRVVDEPFEFVVNVPPGVSHGMRLLFEDCGQHVHRFAAGDVVFLVRHIPHERFRVERKDIVLDATIALVDAIAGFNKTVRHVDGTVLRVVRDQVTFSGFEDVFPGRGLLDPETKVRGDFRIRYRVRFPRRLSRSQRAALAGILDETELEVLEEVIRLQTAAEAEAVGRHMPEHETFHARACNPWDPFICTLEPFWEYRWVAEHPFLRFDHNPWWDPFVASA